jgi:thiosulfate/3-mercaptopyruvate sulfurtransferase
MKNQFREISTEELYGLLNKTEIRIIDIRPVEAYNGWNLENEHRGGHIRGAKSLPAKWANYIDWIEIVRSKGILPEHKIIIYGYNKKEAEEVSQIFLKAKYNDINIYNGFVDEWSSSSMLPMDKMERYYQLVYPQWLHALMNGGMPPNFKGNNNVICHAHYRNNKDYEKGHIPGAINLDTLKLESPETWNRRTSEDLTEALLNLGITKDTTVILYGRFSFPDNDDPFPGSSAGHLGAIRCAFIMMYAGVNDVRILNGGIRSWEDEGYETTTEESVPCPANKFGAKIPVRPELAVDIPEAKVLLKSDDGDLVCVRSWNEYTGEVSGYNYIKKKGRIPGAIFGNCGSDAYHMENYRNLDHTTREYHEIADLWNEAGIYTDKHIAFYCGTGWRGSEAFFNAYLMGWPRISVFDGGWFEWSNDPENPVESGIPEKIKV